MNWSKFQQKWERYYYWMNECVCFKLSFLWEEKDRKWKVKEKRIIKRINKRKMIKKKFKNLNIKINSMHSNWQGKEKKNSLNQILICLVFHFKILSSLIWISFPWNQTHYKPTDCSC